MRSYGKGEKYSRQLSAVSYQLKPFDEQSPRFHHQSARISM
jgi:hypothetical protein